MTEEEKKAIEDLKEEINKPLEVPEDKFDTFILYNIESARIILNLIEKLQKERDIYYYEYKTLEADLINNDIIPKEKIRELIGYYKNEMKSENDLLEQKIITRKDYERRRSLHNNYIHILNKLLE